ncbi:MAG: AsmA family protein [Betaproteobacteria bacterium]|nr:AsmA family protein [Betaproteobacteria bacterium]
MKALRIAGIVIVALAVLVAGAAAYIASQFDAARVKAEASRFVKETRQRTLRIDGDVKLAFWPSAALSIGKVSLSEHRSDKPFASVESARVSVAVMPLLSKRVVVDAVEVRGVKATIVEHKDGSLNIADLMSSEKSQGEPLRLDIAGVKLANAEIRWRDEKAGSTLTISGLDLTTGRVQAEPEKKAYSVEKLSLSLKGRTEDKAGAEAFDVKLSAPKLVITPDKSSGETMTLSATLAGPQRDVSAKLALSGIEGSADVFKIAKLVLDLEAKAGEVGLKGTLESALGGDLAKQTVRLERIAGSFDIAHPRMPMKQVKLPFSGALRADLAKKTADGQLSTRFDESKIALKFGVPKFSPLALSFDLDVDRLNVDKYLPPKKAEEKKAEADGKLDFSALRSLDLTGVAKVGQLQVANVKAADLRVQVRAAGGKLDLAPLSAKLYDGTASGGLSLNASGNALAVKQNLVNININPLLKDAANRDILEGRGNVSLDVTSRGETVAAMKKALAGSASMALKDGAIKGINLAQTFRDLKTKYSSKQDAVQKARATEKTDFSEMSGSFKIAGGVAHNEDLSVKSPFLRLAGNGDIDIGASQLNYLAKASVVATSAGQGAKDLEHLKGVTVPVRLTGPFDSPSWKIEFADLATEAVKARVEEKKQEVRQKAQDQVREKLKGLFGR